MVKIRSGFKQTVILIPPTAGEESQVRSFASLRMTILSLAVLLAGCTVPASQIPGVSKDHPAQKFYKVAQQGMLGDRVCLDNQGDPAIPMGKIQKGEGYTKLAELTAGVFRFGDTATGKAYLGVSFLQYNGFLQVPKVCAWEDPRQE